MKQNESQDAGDSEFVASAGASHDRIRDFVAEAKSIQDLLRDYQQQSESLKSDLSGFVRREIDEHARLAHLRATVSETELSSIKNGNFVSFAANYSKKEPATAPSLSLSTVSATNWWVERLRASESSWVRQWCPDAVLPLAEDDCVAQVLLGWRTPSKASAAAFGGHADRVYTTAAAAAGDAAVSYDCFANGLLCTRSIDGNVVDTRALCEGACRAFEDTVGEAADVSSLAACALSAYNTELLKAAAMSRLSFAQNIWPGCDGADRASAAESSTTGEFRLQGDGSDLLAFVSPHRLKDSITLRAFFFRGSLGIVEQLGAEVDMTSRMLPGDGAVGTDSCPARLVQTRLACTFDRLYKAIVAAEEEREGEQSSSAAVNLVLTAAIRLPAEADGFFGGVVLDTRAISPQLPFEGRLSWMEVCAVGQQRSGAPPSGEHGGDVLFRLAYLPVASLVAYDKVSSCVFPRLSEAVDRHRMKRLRAKPASGPTAGKAAPLRQQTVAFLWAGTVSAVVVLVAVKLWRRGCRE